MQRDSAAYMFVFAGIVCVVCAVLVSGSAVSLSERQDANAAFDKQQNVLFAAGLASRDMGLNRAELESIFEERVEPAVIDLKTGQEVDAVDPLTYDMEKAAAGEEGMDAPQNPASIKRLPPYAVVYKVMDRDRLEMVVLPIKGYGLWSTLYGFLAVDADGETVRGITYYQHGETPGLGGEVDNPGWKAKWPGRKIYDDSGDVELEVVKGQAGPPSSDPYQVDGLSGATITSRGVSNMIEFWMSDERFGAYLETL